MPRGHAPFAVLNRSGNLFLRGVLSSPLHRPLSGRLALITVTGRRSGRQYTFPVGYRRDGDRVTIEVGWPERKVWWRNLRGAGGPVRIRMGGEERTGHARAVGTERGGVRVDVRLD